MADAAAIQESPEALARIPERIVGERNPRGIPSAVFVVRTRCGSLDTRHRPTGSALTRG